MQSILRNVSHILVGKPLERCINDKLQHEPENQGDKRADREKHLQVTRPHRQHCKYDGHE